MHLDAAVSLYEQNELDAAMRELDAALRIRKKTPFAHYWKGMIALKTGKLKDAERAFRSRELRDTLEEALAAIEEPYRSIVVMREIQDMTYAEIVDALEMPLNTVKVYLRRGRRMLRDALRGKV